MEENSKPRPSKAPMDSTDIEALREILFSKEKEALVGQIEDLGSQLKSISSPDFLCEQLKNDSALHEISHQIESYLAQVHKTSGKDGFTNSVGASLPKAIEDQLKSGTSEFSDAMAPMVGKSIQFEIKNNKDKIVDALYPIIGSTIAKYMSEALQDMMEGINDKIEQKTSLGGVVRKMKSSVLGLSEAELLFQDSIQPKIQSIFLIHKKTGLSIADAHASDQGSEDSGDNMMAGMFSAITSFINTWIQKDGDLKEVDAIDYGESKIFFETSGSVVAAVVVDQGFKKSLRMSVRKFLELFHTKYYDFITEFDGDIDSIPQNIKAEVSALISIPSAAKISDKKNVFTFKNLFFLGAITVIFIGLLNSTLTNYKNSQLRSGLESALSQDFFLAPLKLRVGEVSEKSWKVQGIAPAQSFIQRIQMVSTSVAPALQANTEELVILEKPVLPEGTPEKVQQILKTLTKGNLYSSVRAEVSAAGNLQVFGFSDQPLLSTEVEQSGFFTNIQDNTQRLTYYENHPVVFPVGVTAIEGRSAARLTELLKHIKSHAITSIALLVYTDSSQPSALQNSINTSRTLAVQSFIRRQSPGLMIQTQNSQTSPFRATSISTLKNNRSFVLLPQVTNTHNP